MKNLLKRAQEIIGGDREKTYGKPGKNLRNIAIFWSTHLSARLGIPVTVTAADVCVMMVHLKLARLANRIDHEDSAVDAAGYLALLESARDVD